MARCNRCGKGGLFFRVNAGGRCPECERNLILQSEYTEFEEAVRRMKADLWAAPNSYDALKKKEKEPAGQMAGVAKKGPLPEGIPDAGGESAGLPEAVRANVSAYRLMAAIVIGAEFQNLLLDIRVFDAGRGDGAYQGDCRYMPGDGRRPGRRPRSSEIISTTSSASSQKQSGINITQQKSAESRPTPSGRAEAGAAKRRASKVPNRARRIREQKEKAIGAPLAAAVVLPVGHSRCGPASGSRRTGGKGQRLFRAYGDAGAAL